jgi:L,D-transpeptidase catalytic domain
VRRAAAAGAVALAAGAALLAPRASEPVHLRAATAPALPDPVRPAFTPGQPHLLGSLRDVARWAPVQRPAVARAAPGGSAPFVTRLGTLTPEGTRNAVAVLRTATDAAGRPWALVRLPVLPNGSTGWVRRTALGGYGIVRTHLVVDRARLEATLERGGRPVLRVPVGIGAPGWETPRGEFYVRNRLTRYRSPAYGPIAFGTSARSPHATGWPAGGFVGIHGTDRPDLIPGRVSHGCIRLRNADIRALARLMPVGTPVTVR